MDHLPFAAHNPNSRHENSNRKVVEGCNSVVCHVVVLGVCVGNLKQINGTKLCGLMFAPASK